MCLGADLAVGQVCRGLLSSGVVIPHVPHVLHMFCVSTSSLMPAFVLLKVVIDPSSEKKAQFVHNQTDSAL